MQLDTLDLTCLDFARLLANETCAAVLHDSGRTFFLHFINLVARVLHFMTLVGRVVIYAGFLVLATRANNSLTL